MWAIRAFLEYSRSGARFVVVFALLRLRSTRQSHGRERALSLPLYLYGVRIPALQGPSFGNRRLDF